MDIQNIKTFNGSAVFEPLSSLYKMIYILKHLLFNNIEKSFNLNNK